MKPEPTGDGRTRFSGRGTNRSFYLARLPREYYQGDAVVHWTMPMALRGTGWLNEAFHARFREGMLHAAAREGLFCPTYCLMPDHIHPVWMGLRRDSNQRNGMKFLREHLGPALRPHRFQHQAHDHVLREKERTRGAFAKVCFGSGSIWWGERTREPGLMGFIAKIGSPGVSPHQSWLRLTRHLCFYIVDNARVAKLVEHPKDWLYAGAVVPGYPALRPLADGFWPLFWKLYFTTREPDIGNLKRPPLGNNDPAHAGCHEKK